MTKTIFIIPLPEALHEINDGDENLELEAELPFRPQIMDTIVPANLLYEAEGVLAKPILDHFFDGQEFVVTQTTILKDEEGEFYLDCYCEPASNFEQDGSLEFLLGHN